MVLIKDLGMLYPTKTSKFKTRYGIYECKCGKHVKANTSYVKNGNQQTCSSCRSRKNNTKHGYSKTKSHSIWRNMMSRCYNKKNKSYKNYGARGIIVCNEWHDFLIYKKWFEKTNIKGLTMDRTNNDGNYEPNNIKWKNMSHQAHNNRELNSRNTSGYRGVFKVKKGFISRIKVKGINYYLGTFKTKEKASEAYKRKKELLCH